MHILRSALVAAVVLVVTEAAGLGLGLQLGILLLPAAPFLIGAGVLAGVPALIAGLVRRRRGASAGGVSGGDLLVHGVLLMNAVLVVVALAWRSAAQGDEDLAATAVVLGAGAVALVGIPASVVCSWQRAFAPMGPRGRNVVVALSHATNLLMVAVLLNPAYGSLRAGLLGSSA